MKPAVSFFLLLMCLYSPLGAPGPEWSGSCCIGPDVDERIARIESGLLYPVVIKGERPEQMKLVDRMAHYKTPGFSIAFINNGRVEWARGYGIRQAGLAEPVTANTLFQAGSISKAVTAVAALRLVEMGKLDLDEDVNQKLVSWKVPENEFTRQQKITLRELLSHTAGINLPSFIGYLAGEPVPTLRQVLDGEKPANTPAIRVVDLPGKGFTYSGGGYAIVQQMLIDVTKRPFPELMNDLVFKPLGMKHSTFQQALPTRLEKLAAAGHNRNAEIPKGRWRTLPEMAAAGLWTTPSDLAKLVIEIQKARDGASTRFLSRSIVSQMLTRQNGPWGLGFSLEHDGSEPRFSHGGSTLEFNSYLLGYEKTGQGVVVMANALRGDLLINEVLRSLAREYQWTDFQPKERTIIAIDPKLFARYLGRYQFAFSADFKLVIGTENGNLTTELQQPTGTSKAELYPGSESSFFRKDADVVGTFVSDESGRVTHLIFTQDGQDLRADRVRE